MKIIPVYRLPTYAGTGPVGLDLVMDCLKAMLPADHAGDVTVSVYISGNDAFVYTLTAPGEKYERLPPGRFIRVGDYRQQIPEDVLLEDIVGALIADSKN